MSTEVAAGAPLRAAPWHGPAPDHTQVASFVAGPGIERLAVPAFDVARLRSDLDRVLARTDFDTTFGDHGFATLPVTRRPGTSGRDLVDLSGRFWIRGDDRYIEEPREDIVDEAAYTELDPAFEGTYFQDVIAQLRTVADLGRIRLNFKQPFNANSWHRDPEPRLHVPIITNPGCLFTVNNHTTHLPADGSTYFTDTRAYHTALNGGDTPRLHLIAAVVGPRRES